MVDKFIKIFGNKHNIARMRAQLQSTSKISYMLVDRLECAANTLKSIKAGDRHDTIMSIIDIAIPGYKNEIERTKKTLKEIDNNELISIATAQGLNERAIRTYLSQGINEYFEEVSQDIELNNWINFGRFSATSLDETTYLKVYDENYDSAQLFKYNK